MNNDFERENKNVSETAGSSSEVNNTENNPKSLQNGIVNESFDVTIPSTSKPSFHGFEEVPENDGAYTEDTAAVEITEEDSAVIEDVPSSKDNAPYAPYSASTEAVYSERPATPGGDSYLYSKADSTSGHTVGCVWDSSTGTPKKQKADKSSSSGFKVFVAAMLGVFTVASVTIAGFLAADYLNGSSALPGEDADTKTPEKAPYTYNQPVQSHTSYPSEMVSAFTVEGTGLTKSQVAAKCSPSAVGIVIEAEQSYSGYSYNIPFFGDFGYPGGTQIVRGSGSGFVYSADGYIITNHHVIEGATKITVHFMDGKTAEATLVGSDALSDIAVIKVEPADLTLVPMEIGDSSLMNVGDEVIAIGCPAGIEFMGTVTDGIISAINRDVELDNDGSSTTKTMTLLQTNATINRGNSGGPLINSGGQVIGINTLKLSADYEGIGFSIPINGALPIITQLIEHGKVVERTESFVSSEGMIGISTDDISEQEAKYYEIPQGVLVVQIGKDSSSAKAGLRRGDIITKFNGEEVKTTSELNKKKSSFKAGDEVTLTVYRDSDELTEKYIDITFKLDMAS